MIQDLLLKIIVFLLPTQLGLHFWPDFARLNGIRFDYYSPTLYLIDIFIVAYLALNLKFLQKAFLKNHQRLLILLVIVIFNLLVSLNKPNTFFQFLRLFEYLSLYLILSQISNLWKKISFAFITSLTLVIGLQLVQFSLQRSLGGIFYYFGERLFTGTTPNLPKIMITDSSYIRVPSLFSHPNSLAGYLLLSFLILNKFGVSLLTKVLNILSLFLTFSKSALLALGVYLTKIKFGRKLYVIFITLSILQLFIPKLQTGFYSLDSRSTMVSNYLKLPPQYFLWGAGLGNYPTALKGLLPGSMSTLTYLQPIHNLLILLFVELGVPLTLLLISFLIKNYKNKYLPIILMVLLTGLFDHYWLTLPQNKLILLLTLALFK